MEQEDLIRDYLVDQDEGMRRVVTHFLNKVMQEEAAQQIGADHYERTDKRSAYRNGFKKRNLITRYGEITLNKPQFRDRSFESKVIPKYARVEKALEAAIIESYLQGVWRPDGFRMWYHNLELRISQLRPFLESQKNLMIWLRNFSKGQSSFRYAISM